MSGMLCFIIRTEAVKNDKKRHSSNPCSRSAVFQIFESTFDRFVWRSNWTLTHFPIGNRSISGTGKTQFQSVPYTKVSKWLLKKHVWDPFSHFCYPNDMWMHDDRTSILGELSLMCHDENRANHLPESWHLHQIQGEEEVVVVVVGEEGSGQKVQRWTPQEVQEGAGLLRLGVGLGMQEGHHVQGVWSGIPEEGLGARHHPVEEEVGVGNLMNRGSEFYYMCTNEQWENTLCLLIGHNAIEYIAY